MDEDLDDNVMNIWKKILRHIFVVDFYYFVMQASHQSTSITLSFKLWVSKELYLSDYPKYLV